MYLYSNTHLQQTWVPVFIRSGQLCGIAQRNQEVTPIAESITGHLIDHHEWQRTMIKRWAMSFVRECKERSTRERSIQYEEGLIKDAVAEKLMSGEICVCGSG